MSTPVQQQWKSLKAENPDAVLFFRLGDFYEMFAEDAILGSRVLGITLTARHRGTENEMPMCGMPYHAAKEYTKKLLDMGYKVAFAEQKQEEGNKTMSRYVSHVVTPGTSMSDEVLESPTARNLCAVDFQTKSEHFSIVILDASTGDFRACSGKGKENLRTQIERAEAKEFVLPTKVFQDEALQSLWGNTMRTPRAPLKAEEAQKCVLKQFDVPQLSVLGLEGASDIVMLCAMALSYVQETHKSDLSHIRKPTLFAPEDTMMLDAQTLQHLEIFHPLRLGQQGGTLFSVFDRPATAAGHRCLQQWVLSPLLSRKEITCRQQAITELLNGQHLLDGWRKVLGNIRDIERLVGRICAGRAMPRDGASLRDSLEQFAAIIELQKKSKNALLKDEDEIFKDIAPLTQELTKALLDSPATDLNEGGIFRSGYDTVLDNLRFHQQHGESWLENYLREQKEVSGITSLKCKHVRNMGYFLELSKANAHKAPEHWTCRQTLVSVDRYTTPELQEYEDKILSAEANAIAREAELFRQLMERVLPYTDRLQQCARRIAVVDALCCMAQTARSGRWTCPEVVDHPGVLQIEDGRHPVVEGISAEPFVANSLHMARPENTLHLITGPNMAGKSTFLRQNALMILLAQMGSFVPARTCKLSIFDRIFTRVGASDNLAGGQSTFFVEMLETASILSSATERSFIILDEIGRGTSTFDGISLAWALMEDLHDRVGAFTLFATHYHELIDLAEELPGARNYHISCAQKKDGILFLRKIVAGGISDSFGIEVAAMAGITPGVIARARVILQKLESDTRLTAQPSLFAGTRVREKVIEVEKPSPISRELAQLDMEDISPRRAWEILEQLQESLRGQEPDNNDA